MGKIINFGERKAKKEEISRGCSRPIIVELEGVDQELYNFIDLFRKFVSEATEDGEELTSEKIDKFMEDYEEQEMIDELMEEVTEDKPDIVKEVTDHFIENGDERDLILKVEKESYSSVIIVRYEEIKNRLLYAYGSWLHDLYMIKDHEDQFKVLMELCKISDIEYEDLSDEEKMSFNYIIIHLKNELC